MRLKWTLSKPQPPSTKPFPGPTDESIFQTRSNFCISATTIYLLQPPPSAATTTTAPWIFSTTVPSPTDPSLPLHLRHPLTSKRALYNLPINFDLSKLHPATLAVSYHITSASIPVHKLLAFPPPQLVCRNIVNSTKSTLLALYNGGELQGCPPSYSPSWVKLSLTDKFDDVVVFKGKIYSLNRERKLNFVNNYLKSRNICIGKTLISRLVSLGTGRFGWRKRLVIDGNHLYLVVRTEERFFEVYKLFRRKTVAKWEKVEGFDNGRVLFMARDYYFLRKASRRFPGREYKNCIVFSEAAFPEYGNNGWEFTQSARSVGVVRRSEEDIAVFRWSDGTFAREGENEVFPKINWSPPAWIFQASSDEFKPRLSSESCSQSQSDPVLDEALNSNNRDETDGVNSDLKDLNSKDEKDGEIQSFVNIESDSKNRDEDDGKMQCDSNSRDGEDGKMQCDSNSQEKEDEEMHSNTNVEGTESLHEAVSPSLVGPESETTDTAAASLSAAEKEVTRTLLSMIGKNDATEQGTPRKNITQSVPRACTSSPTMSHASDSTITKFEGFEIKSELVSTLQKIWRKHGNIVESSTIRNADIIARALESLATMVKILEDNSAQSLSDSQADYLSSTLSDLKCLCFKVDWLIPSAEKAVKLHKGKHLPDSLKKLSQLHSQVKGRRAVLFGELAKLGVEENKLKEEMAKVSKKISLYGKVKFDEPLGLGLT